MSHCEEPTKMMGDKDDDDPYITKLQSLFMSCDPRAVGLLGRDQIHDLCHQLQLDSSQSRYLIDQLVGQDPYVKVDFDEFKEVFLKLLTMDTVCLDEEKELHDTTLVREYLKSTWTKLGLPENGHLSLEDLGFVCSEIGMADVSEEAIEQLFTTLDRDCDGKVSFEELLAGMSSQQELLACKNENVDPQDKEMDQEEEEEEEGEGGRRSDRNFSTSPNFLISLSDPKKDGLVDVETVTRLWESLGFTDAKSILKDLGLIGSQINVQNLSDLLEEELFSVSSPSQRGGCNLAQVAFVTFRNEFNQLKVHLDQMSEERVKLKRSVAEANLRADLLAQEVDDHHRQLERSTQEKLMSMEKKHRERLNALEQELLNERELGSHQCLHLTQKLEKEHLKWHESECRSKETIARLEQERNKIACDLRCWIEKCCQLETKNSELSKKFDESLSMTERYQTKSEQHLKLEKEVETARNQSKKLQDLNDELILEVEKLRKEVKGCHHSEGEEVCDSTKKQKIDVSWNENTKVRKSHKKRHSMVTHIEEGNQIEPCTFIHNFTNSNNTTSSCSSYSGEVSNPFTSSSLQRKGLKEREVEMTIFQPQNEPFGEDGMTKSVLESHKMMTCTKFIEYLLNDLNEPSWNEVKKLLNRELNETCNTSNLVRILLQHLNRIRVKSGPRKGFYIKSNVSERLITSLYLETTQQLKLIQELEMKLTRVEKEKVSLNCECKYLKKVVNSQWRRDLK